MPQRQSVSVATGVLTATEYKALSARQKKQSDDVIGDIAAEHAGDTAWFAKNRRGIRENLGSFFGIALKNPYDPDWDDD